MSTEAEQVQGAVEEQEAEGGQEEQPARPEVMGVRVLKVHRVRRVRRVASVTPGTMDSEAPWVRQLWYPRTCRRRPYPSLTPPE